MSTQRPLTTRQRQAVDLLLADRQMSQTAAYQAAGYKSRGAAARTAASRFFKSPRVKEHLHERMAEREARLEPKIRYDQDDVIRWLQELRKRAMEAHEVRDKQGNVVPGVWTSDLAAAFRAVELLGKHLGMFQDDRVHQAASHHPDSMKIRRQDFGSEPPYEPLGIDAILGRGFT